jgi:hypothetical protein
MVLLPPALYCRGEVFSVCRFLGGIEVARAKSGLLNFDLLEVTGYAKVNMQVKSERSWSG